MATASVTNMTKQLKYTGKGYLDYKMQPVSTLAELEEKFTNKNELKLGMVVTVLNGGGTNMPVDYWYYYPYNEETGTYDTSVAPSWVPKVYPGGAEGGEMYWQDGAAPGSADFEAWKDGGIE